MGGAGIFTTIFVYLRKHLSDIPIVVVFQIIFFMVTPLKGEDLIFLTHMYIYISKGLVTFNHQLVL